MNNKDKNPLGIFRPKNEPVMVSICRYKNFNGKLGRVSRLYYPARSSLARVEGVASGMYGSASDLFPFIETYSYYIED